MSATEMTPLDCYQRDLDRPRFSFDPAQHNAVEQLSSLHFELCNSIAESQPESSGLLRWFTGGKQKSTRAQVRGLYLWGGVGRGKTYLMDTFYNCLPFDRKLRVHFHRFMLRVHSDLAKLKGQPDPLKQVAKDLAREARVVCFDEFFVSDITDAMILGELLKHLFARGVTLVATSNIPPQELYRNGLQRARFLPAIALLEQHCQVLNVDGGVDYRLRTLEQAEIYHAPLDDAAGANMRRYFQQLAPEPASERGQLEINGRLIPHVALADDVLWCSFPALCETARSAADYVELSRHFHTVLLECVPQMGADLDDAARRFIALVDEFYERRVKLILSAAVPLQDLYSGGRLTFEFQRCISRLQEMQSHEYLASAHNP